MQSFVDLIGKLNMYKDRYNRLCELLTFEEVVSDKKLLLKYTKEKRDLESLVGLYKEYETAQRELQDMIELKTLLTTQSELEIAEENIVEISSRLEKAKLEIVLNLNSCESDQENICVEIVETKSVQSKELSMLLVNIYSTWCQNNGFEYEVEVGRNAVKLDIDGKGALSVFKNEVGIHKIFDTDSSCNVLVYTISKAEGYSFYNDELKIEICRSSGAGGQHINTTDSAVKVTHLPTGMTAICQDQRSQIQNKNKAIERLKDKVAKSVATQNLASINEQKKSQLRKISLGDVVRVYDLKNNLVIEGGKEFFLSDMKSGLL